MFPLPISMPHFKSMNFYQNISKIKLFLQKTANFFCAGGSTPDRRASSDSWGFHPQSPKAFPHCKFLAMHLMVLLLLFPQVALSLNKVAHTWAIHWAMPTDQFKILLYISINFMMELKTLLFHRIYHIFRIT